jgi:hypothetical protein
MLTGQYIAALYVQKWWKMRCMYSLIAIDQSVLPGCGAVAMTLDNNICGFFISAVLEK